MPETGALRRKIEAGAESLTRRFSKGVSALRLHRDVRLRPIVDIGDALDIFVEAAIGTVEASGLFSKAP